MAAIAILVMAVLVFFIAALAMPAGVGGGLLYVPVLLFVGLVDNARDAAALSQPIVVGASLAANSFNVAWQLRHPSNKLIDPELALAAIPACLAGAMLGAFLNRALPEIVILALLLLTLAASFRNSVRKGMAMWKKESQTKVKSGDSPPDAVSPVPAPNVIGAEEGNAPHAASQDTPHSDEVSAGALLPEDSDTPHSTFTMFPSGQDDDDAESTMRRRGSSAATASLESGGELSAKYPEPAASSTGTNASPVAEKRAWITWLELTGVWAIVLLALLLRGGKGTPSIAGFEMCSFGYWLVTGLSLLFLGVAATLVRQPGISAILCCGVGVLSAIVGIGGGIILNPMLLSAGVEPMKTTATVTVMILMVCCSATTAFVLAGAIPLLPMGILSFSAFVGSLAGKSIVGWLVSRTGRSSILVFLLAGFMATGSLAVVIQGSMRIAEEVADFRSIMSFSDPCR